MTFKQFVYVDPGKNEYLGIISAKDLEGSRKYAERRWGVPGFGLPFGVRVEMIDTECDWHVAIINKAVLMDEHHKFDKKKMEHFLEKNKDILLRQEINREYGFGIPCAETIEMMKSYGPMLEVGAGTGWWSCLLEKAGMDIVASDWTKRGEINEWKQVVGRYFHTDQEGAEDSVLRYPDRNVLMVWPPRKNPMANEVANAMKVGRLLFAVHDQLAEVIADENFLKTLKSKFERRFEIPVGNYPWTYDRMFIYEKIKA